MRGLLLGVAEYQKHSFIDFPGTVAAVLFFRGCNLRCPYCHNSGIVLSPHPPSHIAELIESHLQRRRDVIEGVVFSGGEPTLHPGLPELARTLHGRGFAVKLDTNGLRPAAIRECPCDYLALDVKTLPERYGPLLGASSTDIAQRLARSIDIVRDMGERAEIRITMVPGIVGPDEMPRIADMMRGVSRVFLQQFRPRPPLLDRSFESVVPYTDDELAQCRDELLEQGIRCLIR